MRPLDKAHYVVFGSSAPQSVPLTGTDLNGTNGFVITGITRGPARIRPIGAAGDFNGDGFDDFLVGDTYAEPGARQSGSLYVIFGTDQGFPALLDIRNLTAGQAIRIDGTGGIGGQVNFPTLFSCALSEN